MNWAERAASALAIASAAASFAAGGQVYDPKQEIVPQQAAATIAELSAATTSIRALEERVKEFDSKRRGVVDAYLSLRAIEANYPVLISALSGPNTGRRYPEETFVELKRRVAQDPTFAALTPQLLNIRKQDISKRIEKLVAGYPTLPSQVSAISNEIHYPVAEIPAIDSLLTIEHRHDPKAAESTLLMRLAEVQDKQIRYVALRNLGRITEGKREAARYLHSVAYGFRATKDYYNSGNERFAAVTALADIGPASEIAIPDLAKELTVDPMGINQLELPTRALRRIGTPKALAILDRFERKYFGVAGVGKKMPRPARGWKGLFSEILAEEIVLIRDREAWKELWIRHSPFSAVPAVDFSKEMVFGVFMGASHIEALRVAEVRSTADKVTIVYEMLYPDFIADDNFEFLLARLPRTDGSVEVRMRHEVAMSRGSKPKDETKKIFPKL